MTEKPTIEKGVPLTRREGINPPVIEQFPYADMEVGDSFIMSGCSTEVACHRSFQFRMSADRFKGWRFAHRRQGNVVRVWRVL